MNNSLRDIYKKAKEMICDWHEEDNYDYIFWETDCGKSFGFTEGGTPAENDFAFCPYCGKVLNACELVREVEDD